MSTLLSFKTQLKIFTFLILIIGLSACNEEEIADLKKQLDANDSLIKQLESERCKVEQQNENSAILNCGSGGSFLIENGEDGTSCDVESTVEGAMISCNDGSYVEIHHGRDGKDGSDSFQCISTEVDSVGTVIQCGFEIVVNKKKN